MTKEEIIEAITSTIVANGKKGITAESLANLLIEMASATHEGSGGSGGVLFYTGIPNEDFTQFTLTEEEQSHNAAMYNAFVNSNTVPISFDMTRYYISMMQSIGDLPEGITSENMKKYMTSIETSYIDEETATILESPYFGILSGEAGVVVQPDGSIAMLS